MEILTDDLIRLILIQMQAETALSVQEKEQALEKLEKKLIQEGYLDEKE
ncbi:MAG: hypothetical protein IJ740_05830 [Ruminococcus sp.]|nr:hypothetical protein [Ruminococcus sp.]